MAQIVSKEEFKKIRKEIKAENKKIVLCHGVFDLIHPGHIIHFQEAKALGDILVVSVTSQNYVRKGPGRPYFNDELRLKFLSSIELIDYVILSECYTVEDIIETVEPDLYVKGEEYKSAEEDITGKISEEVELVRQHGGDVHYTSGAVFSSTKLINKALPALSDEVKSYIQDFKKSHLFNDIKDYIKKLENLKVLVIGDVIIDEYVYCAVQGLMSKDMGYSARYKRSEEYLGGALAVARHISSFTDNVTIMSAIGNEEKIHSRLLNEIGNKMKMDFEYSETYPTIVKQRFITENEKREELHKIFAINNLSAPALIDAHTMERFKGKLKDKISDFDVVILCDFGHGLVDREIQGIIEKEAKFLSVNCQTNSSNYGLNLITKYKRADSFALDQKELKLAMRDDISPDELLLQRLGQKLGGVGWLTQGSRGAIGWDNTITYRCPALTLNVIDTIGAGDAFFALASLCAAIKAPVEVGTFIGNIGGALASNIVGNKESVEKVNVLKYASTLMNI